MDLVLGAVRGLEAGAIAPFLVSLFRTGYTGRVAFWVSDISDSTRAFLDQYGINLIELSERSVFTNTPPNSLRYFVYEQALASMGDGVRNVLLADTRDIVFQRNPSEIETGGDLCCFLENEQIPIRECVANSGWIAAAFGKKVLDSMSHFPISCSGTTLGPVERIRAYVSAMTKTLQAIDERSPYIMHVIPGVDQAVHNFLLRTGALPKVRYHRNEDGPILTLNYVHPEDVRFNAEGMVLNGAGEVAHVVHQYDRHAQISLRVLERLGGGD